MPIVSIIIPCYNQGRYIRETLQSVKLQTFSNFECVIVNDGSTDNSMDEIRSFCENDSRFVFFDNKNEGVSNARNYAIKHSRGEFILPLDADDLIAPNYLQVVLDVFKEQPDIKLVYTDTLYFGRKKGKCVLPDYSFDLLLCRNLIACTALFRKVDYYKTQGYNSNMKSGLEDWDFWLSFLTPNDKVFKVCEPLFFYRIKKSSRSSGAANNTSVLRRQLWQNHKEIYSRYFLDPQKCIEYISIVESPEYKVGQWIIRPLRMLRSLF